ncbi:MAG: hypothetical protein ACP6IP_06525 [Candidatus Njordarchaeia archaeon]
MKKKYPGYAAYKISNNLANGFLAFGVLGLIAVMLPIISYYLAKPIFPFSSPIFAFLLFILMFIYLTILYSLYKLGELTESRKILLGIKIISWCFGLLFFVTPPLFYWGWSMYTAFLGLVIMLIVVPTLFIVGQYYVFSGLGEYGHAEGSTNIAKLSLILILIAPVETVLLIFSLLLSGGPSGLIYGSPYPLICVVDTVGTFAFLALIALGVEFDKITERIKSALVRGKY